MEMEFFVEPSTAPVASVLDRHRLRWYVDLGIARDNLRLYEHPKEKLSHYSDGTTDIEYKFGFAGSRGASSRHRQPHQLRPLDAFQRGAGVDLTITTRRPTPAMPYVIEPAAGLTRSFMAFLSTPTTRTRRPTPRAVWTSARCCASTRGWPGQGGDSAAVASCGPEPLKAKDLAAELRKYWNIEFDDAGAIGRRYRRQDEIGTPVLRDGGLRHPRRSGGHGPGTRRHDTRNASVWIRWSTT